MIMRRKKLLSTLVVIFGFYSNASAQEIVQVKSETVMKLNLYRGIVEITTHSSQELEIVHEMYDYDIFSEKNELVPFKETYRSRKELSVFTSNDTLLIQNESSRELQYLQLRVPENLEMVIDVNHFGKIIIDKTIKPVQAQVFNGEIRIEEAYSSISAVVIREGNIDVYSHSKSGSTSIALSTYDGNVIFNSSASDLNAILKSDLGEIKNENGMTLEETRKIEFEQVTNGIREHINAFWYKGKLGNGKGPSVLITNTRGNIILKRI